MLLFYHDPGARQNFLKTLPFFQFVMVPRLFTPAYGLMLFRPVSQIMLVSERCQFQLSASKFQISVQETPGERQ